MINFFVPKVPKSVQFEVTTRCNLSCAMCPRTHFSNYEKNKDMSFDLFKKVLDDNSQLKTLYLWGVGEPFLNKDFLRMIKLAKLLKKQIIINTNATIMDHTISAFIIQQGVDEVIVSVDGATKEMFESIRECANFDVVCENILDMNRLKKIYDSKKPKVTSNFVLLRKNMYEVLDMLKLAKSLGIEEIKYQNVISLNEEMDNESLLNFNDKNIIKSIFRETKYLSKNYKIKVDLPNFEPKGKPKCPMPFFGPPNIRWDGSVTICAFISKPIPINHILKDGKVSHEKTMFNPLVVGNINDQSLKEIWNNDIYKKLRQSYKSGNLIHPCNICLSQYRVIC